MTTTSHVPTVAVDEIVIEHFMVVLERDEIVMPVIFDTPSIISRTEDALKFVPVIVMVLVVFPV
jgi:hypothetical protein